MHMTTTLQEPPGAGNGWELTFGSAIVRSPDRASGAGLGPVLSANTMQTNEKPVPNWPGRRPRQFGTGFWSLCIGLAAKTGPELAQEARPGAGTGSIMGILKYGLPSVYPEVRNFCCLRNRGGPAGVLGSIFRWFLLGRTAPPAAAPLLGGRRGRPTFEKPMTCRPPDPGRTHPRNLNETGTSIHH